MYNMSIYIIAILFGTDLLKDINLDLQLHKVKYDRNFTPKQKMFFWFIAMINPAFGLIASYRVYHRLYNSKNKLLRKLGVYIYYTASKRFSCDIHPASLIGVPFKVGHSSDIVIGPRVVIGSNCYMFNGVSLGNKHVGSENRMPVIGDNVIIGTGSKILGGIKVSSNCTIGALTLVSTDVSKGKTVVGIPCREI